MREKVGSLGVARVRLLSVLYPQLATLVFLPHFLITASMNKLPTTFGDNDSNLMWACLHLLPCPISPSPFEPPDARLIFPLSPSSNMPPSTGCR